MEAGAGEALGDLTAGGLGTLLGPAVLLEGRRDGDLRLGPEASLILRAISSASRMKTGSSAPGKVFMWRRISSSVSRAFSSSLWGSVGTGDGVRRRGVGFPIRASASMYCLVLGSFDPKDGWFIIRRMAFARLSIVPSAGKGGGEGERGGGAGSGDFSAFLALGTFFLSWVCSWL